MNRRENAAELEPIIGVEGVRLQGCGADSTSSFHGHTRMEAI